MQIIHSSYIKDIRRIDLSSRAKIATKIYLLKVLRSPKSFLSAFSSTFLSLVFDDKSLSFLRITALSPVDQCSIAEPLEHLIPAITSTLVQMQQAQTLRLCLTGNAEIWVPRYTFLYS